jgi:hypothetical protein
MKPMRATQFAFVTFLLLLVVIPRAPGNEQDAKSDVPDSPYYPLAVGCTWKYQMDYGDKGTRVVCRVTKHQEIAGAECALIETKTDDAPTSTEHLRADKAGLARYAADQVAMKPMMPLLKLPVRKGETWNGAIDLGAQRLEYRSEVLATDEPVTVPAGMYNVVVVRTSLLTPGQKDESILTTYYAPSVGPVKRQAVQANVSVTLELTEFSSPKASK